MSDFLKHFSPFLAVPLFLSSPAALPFSALLFLSLLTGSILLNTHFTMQLALLEQAGIGAVRILFIVMVYQGATALTLYGIFAAKKVSLRFIKTATAWFWIELLLSLLKGSLMLSFYPIQGNPWIKNIMVLCLIYELFIKGHILKLGLGISWAMAIVSVIGIRVFVLLPTVLAASI